MSLITEQNDAKQCLEPILQRYWGYDDFLPLQPEAMQCVLDGRDSVVVLPTGGGKSLCFQAPAMQLDGMALVVSPLISLMKDQVDALRGCGVPAAFLNSSLSNGQRRQVADAVRAGNVRLLYTSPEWLSADRTLAYFKGVKLSLIAIDEAHCISAWGHDFRPEYRKLRVLREAFPSVAIHAYTATATARVRADIAEQLLLREPAMLVGSFDRPNLIYRVRRRGSGLDHISDVLGRHAGESGIIYCIARKDVERLCGALVDAGYRALPYHAGMPHEARRRNQESFIRDKAEIMVATVAFGMGIDKPDVRYVVHAGMPKSLEHYQQESGRAGRDGLEAECCLFYSSQDLLVWSKLIEQSERVSREGSMAALAGVWGYCTGVSCRHRSILGHFGQELGAATCDTCDVCLGEFDQVDEPRTVGQKILSCVLRLGQNFGVDYTAKVLHGSLEEALVRRGHDRLTTWGILSETRTRQIGDWIEQLATQRYLEKATEYQLLHVTDEGRALLRGEVTPRLLSMDGAKKIICSSDSWEGVDKGLFEELRSLRGGEADARGVPPYTILGDAALRDMARFHPVTLEQFRVVRGVGENKLQEHGERFIAMIAEYCQQHQLPTNVSPPSTTPRNRANRPLVDLTPAKRTAFGLFRQGRSVENVARQIDRAVGTVEGYVSEFVRHHGLTDPSAWVEEESARRVLAAAKQVDTRRLKPIFEQLGGTVSYGQIRIVIACWENREPT